MRNIKLALSALAAISAFSFTAGAQDSMGGLPRTDLDGGYPSGPGYGTAGPNYDYGYGYGVDYGYRYHHRRHLIHRRGHRPGYLLNTQDDHLGNQD